MKRLLPLVALFCFACADEPAPDPAVGPDLNVGEETPELGKAVFGPAESGNAKEDSFATRKGMPVSVDNGSAQVWKITRDWAATDAAAGMAWPANSGLSWDEKYVAWVESMERRDGHSYGETFTMTTPYGKTLPAPALECAETAMFLRATFASWYGLPFYMQASDRDGRIFIGHFGFLRSDGSRYRSTPNFKSSYRDYSDRASTWERDGWPKDSTLRRRKLGGSQDDFQPFLGDDARAGTYFDELYLNKRTGYFMVFLLSYFGSVNLASPSNLYNLKPSTVRAGDVLVKRYQRTGIGHVYVVKHTERLDEALDVELMSGSMPRRQPKWESAGASKDALTGEAGGGSTENFEGDTYASLGGGIKRWRTPVKQSGYWVNIVPVSDRDTFVDASDHAAIGARPGTFDQILGTVAPEVKRDILLSQISDNREHLRRYPASCSARTRREEAFSKLYDLEEEHFGTRRVQVDNAHRLLEDYALPELVYQESKTCCWNSSNSDMFEIIMLKAQADTEGDGMCAAPTPFMNKDGGYAVFKNFAESIGRGGEWRAWTEDESCPQRDVVSDTQESHDWTPWCEVELGAGPVDPPVGGGDAFEPNDDAANAAVVGLGTHAGELCAGDPADWFAVEVGAGNLVVDVDFQHAEGDIDLEVYAGAQKIGSSGSTGNRETVSVQVGAGTYHVKVFQYGQGGACQNFTVKIAAQAGGEPPAADDDDFEPNGSQAEAAAGVWGVTDAILCPGDEDWYAFDVDNSATVDMDITFTHADGDIDVTLFKGANRVAGSAGTGDVESISESLEAGTYHLQVKHYGNPNGCQPYTIDAAR